MALRGLDICIQPRPSVPDPQDFPAYIAALPQWKQKLQSSIVLTDTTRLLAQLQSAKNLYIVSDGGADGDGSYRAESYGCLAILRLIYHLVTFYSLHPTVFRHTFYCDNKSLIKRLKKAAGPHAPFPRHFIRSDMDSEMQIQDTLSMLAISLTYKHGKGHQDDDDVLESLPCEVILNVECD
jgi:hypothetical protein